MSTGQRCACGRELPPAWPRADAWGRAVCNECWDHESEHAILYGDPTAPKPRGILYAKLPAKPELLSISRPTGGAYGHEGKR
mgnify:CR=1 FL=1